MQQVDDQISRCYVKNPIDGTVLNKYKETGELAAPGQPLYKIANLDVLILRAYISGEQLSELKIGNEVVVRYDLPGRLGERPGMVTWVSSTAEFTPKIIQTKKERINLVYAIKVEVPNDGQIENWHAG